MARTGPLNKRHTVVLAEDQPNIRSEIVALLSPDYDLLAEADNGWQLIWAVMALDPDVIIIDLMMPLLSGLEALRVIKSCQVRGKVLILTANASPIYAQTAFRLGAQAYVLKPSAIEDLPAALRAVFAGEKFTSRPLQHMLVN